MKWKDVSSYSQNDKVRTPCTFELRHGRLSITVTRHIHYPPNTWVLRCNEAGMDLQPLSSKDIDAAKLEAVAIVQRTFVNYVSALNKVNQ